MRKYIVLAALMAALGTQSVCSAAIITVRADVVAVDTNGGVSNDPSVPNGITGPPLPHVDLIRAQGKTFTNTYVSAGTPFQPGVGRVRAIVATDVTQMINGASYTPITTVGGQTLVAISVVDGVLVAPGVVQFQTGKLGFLGVDGFNANDPNTWGLTVTGDGMGGAAIDTVAGSFFAEYTLGPQDFSTWNNGDELPLDASEMNNSAINLVGGQEQSQGRFNFQESYDPTNFVTATPEPVVEGSPGPVNVPNLPYTEGLLFTTSDDIEQRVLSQIEAQFIGGVSSAQNVLNAIGMWGIGSVVTGATNNTVDAGFADWDSGSFADYIPEFSPTGINTSGDFRANANVQGRPTVTPVPEPSSVFALAACALPVLLRMRRRKAAATC
jgi:hypothetical protein